MFSKPTLLIVDDEKNTREGLRASFDEAFEVAVAGNVEGALAILRDDPTDVLITDLKLGAENGMQLLESALKLSHPPLCIMMTAYGTVDVAVEAMKRGAYDFVTKPVNLERLELLIKRGLRERETTKENRELRQQVERKFGLDNMIGASPAISTVMETIRQVAPSRAAVLVLGESGTGKELVARAIHRLSPRASARFVAVHCASLSPQLLESELFGHEKGAFTGATERRIGRFEQASGGTLFLDEIGEIDANTQVKILRVLGERTFERVGGNQTLKADVRLITATNKNLSKMAGEGKFREDLFFRLNVVQIALPPLRARKEDIPLLAQAFVRESCQENGKSIKKIADAALTCLLNYEWPGNVRELRAAIEHGVVMSNSPAILPKDLPAHIRSGLKILAVSASPSPRQPPDILNLRDTEQHLILRALEECGGNRSKAAQKLGISRRTLYRRLQETGRPHH
ncbi:MAG: transcriptional regulator [Verrucomicrobia bacterium]|nr:MAG: transcriptional regulator [Verrucomicrobiota bacterium]